MCKNGVFQNYCELDSSQLIVSEIKAMSENKSTQSNKLVSNTLLRGTSFNFIVICSEVTTRPRLN